MAQAKAHSKDYGAILLRNQFKGTSRQTPDARRRPRPPRRPETAAAAAAS